MKIFPLQIIPCGKLLPFLDTDQNYHNSDFVIKFSQTHLTLSISFREQVEPEIYIKRSNNRILADAIILSQQSAEKPINTLKDILFNDAKSTYLTMPKINTPASTSTTAGNDFFSCFPQDARAEAQKLCIKDGPALKLVDFAKEKRAAVQELLPYDHEEKEGICGHDGYGGNRWFVEEYGRSLGSPDIVRGAQD
ncbi:hypothetical protein RIR_jg34365.t1 [Rhizophagus irregularis DAOM 181602=DAOM 197198]|nr:hypothetical protein RIR_jg34365.t1 [Rhizophagus irregularis DAOM 181602=DAOM 197198]